MSQNKKTTPAVKPTVGVKPETVVPVVETPAVTPEVITPETVAPVVETSDVEKIEAETAEEIKANAIIVPHTHNPASSESALETNVVNEIKHDATIIPSGRFIAENGDEFEFAVNSFTFQGKTYTKEKALSDHKDVLEHLVSVKSFILKKL